MIHLVVAVANTAELLATEAYGAGALLRWESSAALAGTYVEGGTEALVSGTDLYDIWDAAGVVGATWYRTRISNAGGTTFSAYSAALPGVPSLVSVAEVRALVKSRLSDVDLQIAIDREEAWLATKVGTLTGERTDTFTPGIGDTPLYLSRRAESVVVTDDGVTLVAGTDYLFTPSTGQIRRIVGYLADPPRYQYVAGAWRGAWRGAVAVTYTPSDGAAVKGAIIGLVRGTVGETGFASETIGDYSYSRATASGAYAGPNRAGLARSILLRRPAYSMRLRSAMEPA